MLAVRMFSMVVDESDELVLRSNCMRESKICSRTVRNFPKSNFKLFSTRREPTDLSFFN
jgi:hypothetical protein